MGIWFGIVAALISLGWNSWAAWKDPYMGPRLRKFFRAGWDIFGACWNAVKAPFRWLARLGEMRAHEREQYRAVIRNHRDYAARLEATLKASKAQIQVLNSEIIKMREYMDRKTSMERKVMELGSVSVYSAGKAEPIFTYAQGGVISSPNRPLQEMYEAPTYKRYKDHYMCVECGAAMEDETGWHAHSKATGAPITLPKPNVGVRAVANLPQLAGPDMPVTVKGVDTAHTPVEEDIDEQISRLLGAGEALEKAIAVHVQPKEPEFHSYGDAWIRTTEPETHRCEGCGTRTANRGMCDPCNMHWPRAI